MSEAPEPGHKPYLIDPREEGTQPPGIDRWWFVQYWAAAFSFLPRRFQGLPPLFYPLAFTGLLSGIPVAVSVVVQTTTSRAPLPLWLDVAMIASACLYATAGLLQGIGTLFRRQWGLTAVYVWLGLTGVLSVVVVLGIPFRESSDISGADVLAQAVLLVWLGAICVYYHNRRAAFGVKTA